MTETVHDARQYWNRRLDRRWGLRGVGLSGLSEHYNAWLYRVRDHVFHRMVRSLPIDPAGARVLDVGAGVGFYTRRWLALGADVHGIDIADTAVDRLRLRFPSARFTQQDIADDVTALGDGYDVVDAFDVLFHVVDDERHRRALANVHRLLRPGGWFVFTDVFSRRHTRPSPHYVRRSLAEIEDAVLSAGLTIEARRPAFVLMNYPFDGAAWHRAIWRRAVPLARSEASGRLLGAALFGPELLATRLLRESPTTELMICRRPPTGTGPG